MAEKAFRGVLGAAGPDVEDFLGAGKAAPATRVGVNSQHLKQTALQARLQVLRKQGLLGGWHGWLLLPLDPLLPSPRC